MIQLFSSFLESTLRDAGYDTAAKEFSEELDRVLKIATTKLNAAVKGDFSKVATFSLLRRENIHYPKAPSLQDLGDVLKEALKRRASQTWCLIIAEYYGHTFSYTKVFFDPKTSSFYAEVTTPDEHYENLILCTIPINIPSLRGALLAHELNIGENNDVDAYYRKLVTYYKDLAAEYMRAMKKLVQEEVEARDKLNARVECYKLTQLTRPINQRELVRRYEAFEDIDVMYVARLLETATETNDIPTSDPEKTHLTTIKFTTELPGAKTAKGYVEINMNTAHAINWTIWLHKSPTEVYTKANGEGNEKFITSGKLDMPKIRGINLASEIGIG